MDHLINKVITGNATASEKASLDAWIASSEANQKYYEDQLRLWNLIGQTEKNPEVDVDKAWAKFNLKTQETRIIPIQSKNYTFLRIAAVFIVLLVSGALLFLFDGSSKTLKGKEFVQTKQQDSKQLEKGEKTILKNKTLLAKTEQKSNEMNLEDEEVYAYEEIDLIDSSYAKITPSSVLKILDHTPNQPRIASLSGAGLFDIKPLDKDFVLETKELKIKVQGTKFNVKTATEDSKFVEISVEEGYMEVFEKANPNNKINISSNQKYIYDVEKHLFVEQKQQELAPENKWKKLVNKIFKRDKKY